MIEPGQPPMSVQKHALASAPQWLRSSLTICESWQQMPTLILICFDFLLSTSGILNPLGGKPAMRRSVQNGIAERFVSSCRQDLLDHVIVVNERHLKRLMNELISYYHVDRTHLGLGKETPARRKAEKNPTPGCRVVSMPRLGGLHHRYRLAA
jgi:hypothetical protein